MGKAKRWTGEWLVAVDEEGRVMLPVLDPLQPAATHYRISQASYNADPGELRLVPMKVASADDLRPVPQEDTDVLVDIDIPGHFTLNERAAMSYDCGYCGADAGRGCVAQPSGKLLSLYEGTPNVHKDRLKKVTG